MSSSGTRVTLRQDMLGWIYGLNITVFAGIAYLASTHKHVYTKKVVQTFAAQCITIRFLSNKSLNIRESVLA